MLDKSRFITPVNSGYESLWCIVASSTHRLKEAACLEIAWVEFYGMPDDGNCTCSMGMPSCSVNSMTLLAHATVASSLALPICLRADFTSHGSKVVARINQTRFNRL